MAATYIIRHYLLPSLSYPVMTTWQDSVVATSIPARVNTSGAMLMVTTSHFVLHLV